MEWSLMIFLLSPSYQPFPISLAYATRRYSPPRGSYTFPLKNGVHMTPRSAYGTIQHDATVGRIRPMMIFTTGGTSEGKNESIFENIVIIANTGL
jgi:hypothetical protein